MCVATLLLLALLGHAAVVDALLVCPANYTTKWSLFNFRFSLHCCANAAGSPGGGTYCQTPDPGDVAFYCDELITGLQIPALCNCFLYCNGVVQITPTPACIGACTCGSYCCNWGAPCNSSAPTLAPTAPLTIAPSRAPTAPTGAPTPAPVAPLAPTVAPTNSAQPLSPRFALFLGVAAFVYLWL
jgi:hypothetical protein